jgi:PAS domain S-box-containing protein
MSVKPSGRHTKQQLLERIADLQARLEEAEETLRAIREGEVDAVVVTGSRGEQVFSLNQSEAIYRLMVETMDEAGLAVTPGGVILFANNCVAHMLQRPLELIVGRPLDSFIRPRDRESLSVLLETAQSCAVGGRLVLLSGDGSAIPLHVWASPLERPEGLTICLVGVDLTQLETSKETIQHLREQRQALQESEEQGRRIAEELARSNKDLEQFAYVASHDLQEPLRSVTGFLELLERKAGAKLSQEEKQYVDYAIDGAKRMSQMIRDLLAYSRVGTKGIEPQAIKAREPLDEALAALRLGIQESGATVAIDDLPVVLADAAQLAQLFQNLLGNAVKFRCERPLEIRVGAQREGNEWLLWVADNGIGIDPEQGARIFEIFQRLHSRREYPGSGIGLAICKKIVERHGGRIWVQSEPGQGSTFYFTLPPG